MGKLSCLVLVPLVLAACADTPEESRPTVSIDGFIVCQACSLEPGGSITLEADSDRGIVPGYPSDVEVASDGRTAAVFNASGEPLWFDQAGGIIGPFGSLGDGPGEYRRPAQLLSVPDSLVVFEPYGRVTVVDAQSGNVRTLSPFGAQISGAAVISWPHRVAVSFRLWPPVDSVSSITVFDFSGDEAKVVNEVERWSQLKDESALHRRIIARGAAYTFWALEYADYRIVHRDSTGQVIDEARRTPVWAPDGSTDLGYGPAKAPPAWMDAIHQDSVGRVWTVTRVPRDDWEVAWARLGDIELRSEMPASSLPLPRELWQSRIEVFSSGLDSLLVSEIVPGVFEGFVSDGRLMRYSETDLGFPAIELVEFRVDNRSGPGSS